MSKILHIFPDSLFTEGYFDFIIKDKKNNHKFILTDIGANTNFSNPKYEKYIIEKVSTFKFLDFIKLRKNLKKNKYDKLIIHSGYLNYLILAFIFNKKVLNKSILSLWGGSDSKKFSVTEEKKKYKFIAKIYNSIRKKVYSKFKIILSIVSDDYETIKNDYNLNAINLQSVYPFVSNVERNNIKNNKKIKIQICHSGSTECNTLEVLEKLKKYKDCNLEIYAPLAYGNENYIEKVIEEGKKIFGDKFIPIKELMPFDKYNKYLSSLDILINNSTIQQGLGNINLAFYNGVKVFLNIKGENNKLYSSKKLIFSHINEIDKLQFDKLYYISKDDIKKNMNNKFILSFFDTNNSLKIWEKVFSAKI